MGHQEDATALAHMLDRFALGWLEALGASRHSPDQSAGQPSDQPSGRPWGDAALAVGVFPQPDGTVPFTMAMRTFWSEPAAGRQPNIEPVLSLPHDLTDDDEGEGERRLVVSRELDPTDYTSADVLSDIVNLMVDVHGMAPSLLWVQAAAPDRETRVSIGDMGGDHAMGPQEVDGRTVLLTRHTRPAPWLTPAMVSDASVLHHWVVWSSGRPHDPTDSHIDGVADVEATQEWRSFWEGTIEELDPDMLTRLSPEQAVAMVLDDWLLVLHYYDTVDEQVLACRPSSRVEDPAGASRVLPRANVDWADSPVADGQWVVVRVATYMDWSDDDREGRCWAECTPSMRHQLLTEAFESAVVFTSVLNIVEWAGARNYMGTAPLANRVQLLTALVDLPLPEMKEVNARLEAGAGHGVIDHMRRPHDPRTEDTPFPVFVHNIPGRKQRADYEPPTEGTEYHLYYRDEDWLAWAGPMRAAAHDLDGVLAFAKDTGGHETRVFEVTTRQVPIPQ